MKIENWITSRFIKEVRNNKNISNSSMLVVVLIVVGIIFYVSSVSIMNGYIKGIMKIAFEIKSFHITFESSYNYDSALKTQNNLQKDKRVLLTSIYRESKALLSANGKNSGVLYFREVDSEIFVKDKGFDKTIKVISGDKDLSLNKIMVSQKTANKLKLKEGDHLFVFLYSSDTDKKIVVKRLKISGIFTTGFVELDEQLAYIGRDTGESVFKDALKFNILIKLHDYKKAKEFVSDFSYLGYYGFSTWEENNHNDLTALQFEKNIIAFIVILVLFVAILNILTTIYITVLEKNQDIGILKAVGYTPNQISLIFLLYGIYLGIIGIAIGIICGLMVMQYLNEILKIVEFFLNTFDNIVYKLLSLFINIEKPINIEIFSKDFYLDKIYTEISLGEIVFISTVVLFFVIVTSIIPAIRAGETKPNEVIRNG